MKTIYLDKRDDYRLVVISDVHGHKEYLQQLIKKTVQSSDDILIILGDFINRGVNSVETLDYVRDLSQRPNTYVLKGNHEYFIHTCLEDVNRVGDLHEFLKQDYYETIVHSILESSGVSVHEISTEDLHTYQDHQVISYLKSLATMLEFDNHLFVHGGYNKDFSHEGQFLKYDNFNDLSYVQDKKVVVGHWPTCNLRYFEMSNEPFFNNDKNIILIDGGLGVKSSGELNALIIEKKEGHVSYSFDQYNQFKQARVVREHEFDQEESVYVNYPHYEFELVERGGVFSKCIHTYSGKQFSVFNELLDDSNQLITSYYNNFLNLALGTEVFICEAYETCVLVKYQGEFGWLLRDQVVYSD